VSVDHWAIGILIYEMITGSNPFFVNVHMNQMALFKSIVKDQYKPPTMVSEEAKDIVAQLLIKDAAQRLGSLARGPIEIIEHPWFQDINIDSLRARDITAPWIPEIEDSFDLSYFNDWSKLQDKTTLPQAPISKKHENLFKDF
jgi:serine/threonine protein kinase